MRIGFCGDIMPGGVLPYQPEYISVKLKKYLQGFDIRVGTLECAIGNGLAFDEAKMAGRQNIIYARNEDLFRIKDLDFTVVSLANNHVFDLGEQGLLNTMKQLTNNGIQYCGAGKNAEEASLPAVVNMQGVKIAFLAYCTYGFGHWQTIPIATPHRAGINPLDMEKVEKDIIECKRQFDKVFVLPHWGQEYTGIPTRNCILMGKKMIEAGADGVFGSHSHHIQPLISYKHKPICFSMGNFMFPDFYIQSPRPIYYPEANADLIRFKDIYDYPFPIEENVRRVWPVSSRIGSLIDVGLFPDKKVKQTYIILSENNIIENYDAPQKCKMSQYINGLSIKHKTVNILIRLKNKILNERVD